MSFTIGIVGLPNIGKSTLFSSITKMETEIANYPFATIEPNISAINILDERMNFLNDYFSPKKLSYSKIIFKDIAGLIAGSSKGEGLGNKFLTNIRESDVILHMVRLFEDKNIIHVHNEVNPIKDIKIINLELILSDLEQVDKWISKNEKKILTTGKGKFELDVIKRVKKILLANKKLTTTKWVKEEINFIKNFQFLTLKSTFYVANISEDEILDIDNNELYLDLKKYLDKNDESLIWVSAKLEHELSQLNDSDRREMIANFNLSEDGITQIAKLSLVVNDKKIFFTCGEDEVKSYICNNNFNAPQSAGIIHSDIERGFIKLEVYNINDLIKYKDLSKVKEKGLIRLEGKDYIVAEGDICFFKFNV